MLLQLMKEKVMIVIVVAKSLPERRTEINMKKHVKSSLVMNVKIFSQKCISWRHTSRHNTELMTDLTVLRKKEERDLRRLLMIQPLLPGIPLHLLQLL